MMIPNELIELILEEGDYRRWREQMTELIKEYHQRIYRNTIGEREIIRYSRRYSKKVWDDQFKCWSNWYLIENKLSSF